MSGVYCSPLAKGVPQMGRYAEVIVPAGRLSLMYADNLLKGIKAEDFARMPPGVKLNSPAFNYGHLSNYPDRFFDMIGEKGLAQLNQNYLDWFSAGKECLDDPAGKIYPSMSEIVERFRSRYTVMLQWLEETPDEVLAAANPSPNERIRKLFPTLAAHANFVVGGHCQTHLGQVSAWRRVMGYGPAEI